MRLSRDFPGRVCNRSRGPAIGVHRRVADGARTARAVPPAGISHAGTVPAYGTSWDVAGVSGSPAGAAGSPGRLPCERRPPSRPDREACGPERRGSGRARQNGAEDRGRRQAGRPGRAGQAHGAHGGSGTAVMRGVVPPGRQDRLAEMFELTVVLAAVNSNIFLTGGRVAGPALAWGAVPWFSRPYCRVCPCVSRHMPAPRPRGCVKHGTGARPRHQARGTFPGQSGRGSAQVAPSGRSPRLTAGPEPAGSVPGSGMSASRRGAEQQSRDSLILRTFDPRSCSGGWLAPQGFEGDVGV